ncbi:MAG: class I SAM-dependent methyltransferase [Bacteroidota bacterium]
MKETIEILNSKSRRKTGLFHKPDYNLLITNDHIEKIRNVEYVRNSQYAGLDIANTLEFFTKRYVQQAFDFIDIDSDTIVADIGTGFGWLPLAFVFSTEAKVIAVEPDKERLEAAKKIAQILGVSERIDWRVGGLGFLPLSDKEADVVYCIEVLEHVYRDKKAIPELRRVSGDYEMSLMVYAFFFFLTLYISTPLFLPFNFMFPALVN